MPKKSHKKLLRNGKGSGKKSQRGGANEGSTEYKIVDEKEERDFIKSVNEWLRYGWVLQGGVSITDNRMVQALKYIPN